MKIYVANISFQVSEENLKDLFLSFGSVTSAKIITDRETNRSRGFGFVEMPSDQEGSNAITGLNNKDIHGRVLAVSVARPQKSR